MYAILPKTDIIDNAIVTSIIRVGGEDIHVSVSTIIKGRFGK